METAEAVVVTEDGVVCHRKLTSEETCVLPATGLSKIKKQMLQTDSQGALVVVEPTGNHFQRVCLGLEFWQVACPW